MQWGAGGMDGAARALLLKGAGDFPLARPKGTVPNCLRAGVHVWRIVKRGPQCPLWFSTQEVSL